MKVSEVTLDQPYDNTYFNPLNIRSFKTIFRFHFSKCLIYILKLNNSLLLLDYQIIVLVHYYLKKKVGFYIVQLQGEILNVLIEKCCLFNVGFVHGLVLDWSKKSKAIITLNCN